MIVKDDLEQMGEALLTMKHMIENALRLLESASQETDIIFVKSDILQAKLVLRASLE